MSRGRDHEEPVKDGAALQELAASVVHGVYRAVKACQFHADVSNDAVTALTASSATNVAEYCARAGTETVALSFLGDAIFVNRQILKASRDTHALAAELRGMLETCEVTELTLSRSVDRAAMALFAKLLADVQRDKSLVARLTSGEIAGIKAGKARFATSGAAREETPGARAARTYATSVLTVQGALAEVGQGKFELPRKIKRVAQQLVARAEEDSRLLVALAATGGVSGDSATIAVGSAILSVAMARQLSTDRAVLANAAMTALLYDAGRLSLLYQYAGDVMSGGGQGPQRMLNDDELDRVPARTVVALTALGRMHAPARARTALLYEVWSLRRAHRRGQPYGGRRPPTLLARIIGVARAFAELRGAGAGGGLSIDDALQMLSNRAADGTERALVKLLIGALGIYPAGTMVTLNTGELGVVMGTPSMPLDYVRPPVKILYDEHANLLENPVDVDLASPPPGQPVRFIWKSVDADEQQMKAMRAYVVAATAAKRRGALDPSEEQIPRSSRAVANPANAANAANPTHPQLAAVAAPPARPVAEATLQSALEQLAPRRAERQPSVLDAEPGHTLRPPQAGAGSPAPAPSPRSPIFVHAPPPPSSRRAPGSAPGHEPTPRSANVAPPSPDPPQAAPAKPVVQRRRDPRNDSDPPSSMQDDVLSARPMVRPARAVPPVAPAPIAPAAAPVAPAAKWAAKGNETATVRPPRSSLTPEKDGAAGHLPPDSTRQMTWDTYEKLLEPERGKGNDKATAPPPPSVDDDIGPSSERDNLLAAFLNDAPLDGTSEPPPPRSEGGGGKVSNKREDDG